MCTFKKDIERDRKRRMTDRELMCTFNKEIERERERWKEIMIKTERQIDIETGKISEMERYWKGVREWKKDRKGEREKGRERKGERERKR
jgi:hypothetical protein